MNQRMSICRKLPIQLSCSGVSSSPSYWLVLVNAKELPLSSPRIAAAVLGIYQFAVEGFSKEVSTEYLSVYQFAEYVSRNCQQFSLSVCSMYVKELARGQCVYQFANRCQCLRIVKHCTSACRDYVFMFPINKRIKGLCGWSGIFFLLSLIEQ